MFKILLCGIAYIAIFVSTVFGNDIFLAIDSADVAQVKSIIGQNPNLLNTKNSDGLTPLNLVSYRGNLDLVQILLNMGADVNIGDNENSQPIHNTAVMGHTDVVDLLLAYGVDIDVRDNNGMTALMFAISYRKNETAAFLLEKNADVKIANNNGLTALHYAALRGQLDLIEKIIALGADVNARTFEGETPLHYTVWRHQLEAAELLLQSGADTEIAEDYGRTPLLHVARETGRVEMAQLLIKYGANINVRDKFDDTPLILAAWKGFSAIVNLLLDKNVEVPIAGDNGPELLTYATEKGLNRLFKIMLDKGVDLTIPNRTGGTLLHAAAKGGSAEICYTLINKGFDINKNDAFGWSPLHYAAYKGRYEVAELLISKGAELNALTLSGNSAYNLADAEDITEVKQLLITSGADQSRQEFPELIGPFMGQTPPGETPQLFAPDIVSTNRGQHSAIAFSPDGTQAFWSSFYMPSDSGYAVAVLMGSEIINGKWTVPQFPEFTIPFETRDDVPFFAPDGKKLYFLSRRPLQEEQRGGNENIWFMDKTEMGWSRPQPVPGEINKMQMHWQFSVASNGAIYFVGESPSGYGMGDIYRSEFIDGKYQIPQNLGSVINTLEGETCPYIAPDESYIIYESSGLNGGGTEIYLYVSFKTKDNKWTEPIFTGLMGLAPLISPDGKYLFYNGKIDNVSGIYWLKADFLNKLRPSN